MRIERRGFLASIAGAALALVGVRAKPKGITIDDCLEGARRVAEKDSDLLKPGYMSQAFMPGPKIMGMWQGMEGASLGSLRDAGWDLPYPDCVLSRDAFVIHIDRERELVTFAEKV